MKDNITSKPHVSTAYILGDFVQLNADQRKAVLGVMRQLADCNRKHQEAEHATPTTMGDETLSLVKLAQEICINAGKDPREATAHLLLWAREYSYLAYLLEADQEQAIAELDRRFSGYEVKPWEAQP